MTQSQHSIPDNSSNQSDGQFTDRHIDPPAPESPLEAACYDRPLGHVPTWKIPKTKEDAMLMLDQMYGLMHYFNTRNPNIQSIPDLMDYYDGLEIQLQKQTLERAANLEYDLTQNQFDGFIAGGNDIKENYEPLLDGLWPRKGLCLMFAPPSFGKTLVTFELMKRLDLPMESMLYCGADEDEEGIGKKLKSLGYSQWPFTRLPDGQTNTLAWENIERWEEYSREHKRRFLILDLLMDYAPMEINNPGSIVSSLSPILAFAHRHNVVVLGLCHTSKNSPNAPTGHQSLWGKCNRLLQLRETQDSNTVELVATRRGPKKSVLITHDWIDTVEAKRVFSGTNANDSVSDPKKEEEPKKSKIELAIEWLEMNNEYTANNVPLNQIMQAVNHDPTGPISIGRETWRKALKQIKEA